MGYYDKKGCLGTYKGVDVCSIDYVLFTKDRAKEECIFAVKGVNRYDPMPLVYQGEVIGWLSDDGDIAVAKRREKYKFYERKFHKTKPQEETKEVEVKVEMPQIDYTDYTYVVDSFFEGLHELWKEMEV